MASPRPQGKPFESLAGRVSQEARGSSSVRLREHSRASSAGIALWTEAPGGRAALDVPRQRDGGQEEASHQGRAGKG